MQGKLRLEGQNGEPIPAPGLLAGSRTFPPPEALMASLSMHLSTWWRGWLPKPERPAAGALLQGSPGESAFLKALKAKAVIPGGFTGEAVCACDRPTPVTPHVQRAKELHGALPVSCPTLPGQTPSWPLCGPQEHGREGGWRRHTKAPMVCDLHTITGTIPNPMEATGQRPPESVSPMPAPFLTNQTASEAGCLSPGRNQHLSVVRSPRETSLRGSSAPAASRDLLVLLSPGQWQLVASQSESWPPCPTPAGEAGRGPEELMLAAEATSRPWPRAALARWRSCAARRPDA